MKKQAGFTLVELSIVLVILGLLVGGVLTGQALIHSAELRSIATEKDKIVVAINTFRDKYMALPGDMTNAASYWSDCGTNTQAASGCNGDGNGLIQITGPSGAVIISEHLKIWRHLSRAGMIEGSYNIDPASNGVIVTFNTLPKAKFPQAYWNSGSGVEIIARNAQETATSDPLMRNRLSLGSIKPGAQAEDGWVHFLPTLTNADAFNIDTKMDDGRANNGNLRGTEDNPCYDQGTDYYSISAAGPEAAGNCYLTWFL